MRHRDEKHWIFALLVGFSLASTPALSSCRPVAPPMGPRIHIDLPLVDAPGRRFSLQQARGKVTVLAFVASWCVPCQMVLQRMLRVQALYGKKIAMVAVATDRQVRFSREFKRDLHLPFPLLVGNSETMHRAGLPSVPLVPLVYVLDKEGRIRYAHKGLVTTKILAQEVGRILDLGR